MEKWDTAPRKLFLFTTVPQNVYTPKIKTDLKENSVIPNHLLEIP